MACGAFEFGLVGCVSCCCFWFIFACVAIPYSLASIPQGQMGLRLLWTSQQIDDKVWTSTGIQNVGLGNSMIKFPSTFQTMYMVASSKGLSSSESVLIRGPVYARSSDGLGMTVSASFQWKLEPRSLKSFYLALGEDYSDHIERLGIAAIMEACSSFTADMFFTNRTQIGSLMMGTMNSYFNTPQKGVNVSIQGLQLREVELPDEFDAEIAYTQVNVQDYDVAVAERDQQRIQLEQKQLLAQQSVLQNIQAALGRAEKIRLENEATVSQTLVYQEQQARANAAILQLFENSTDPFGRLFEIMEIRALADHSASQLLVTM